MAATIAMLRGVNVGSNKRIRMERLRALCQLVGLVNPQTLLQSGNVVFEAGNRSAETVRKSLEAAIEAEFAFHAAVLIREAAEMAAAIGLNPFEREAIDDPSHLLVMFLEAAPSGAAVERLKAAHVGPEKIAVRGREAYLHYPAGIGRSKLTNAVLEKGLGVSGTARNWNTATGLLAMAEALAAS
jgi:uncharacterized protein (DUF1697 family)